MPAPETEVHLYWATGCTSCLRVKEFLERNDVSFVSHNIVESNDDGSDADSGIGVRGADQEMVDEMLELGLPGHVPVVRYGEDWSDGKDLQNVANLLDIEYDTTILPIEELYRRLDIILTATREFVPHIPEDEFETDIPNRPRSYAELVQHTFSLPDVFLMHEAGVPMDGVPRMEHSWDPNSHVALDTYGQSVHGKLDSWFESRADRCDWADTADVFWGQPSKHEFFERTTWHTGQHARQLEWILREELDVSLEEPLSPALWEDLPMPEKIWNDG